MCGCICFSSVFLLCLGSAVYCKDCPYDKELKATHKYKSTVFNQSLPALSYNGQMECEWTIESRSHRYISLNFTSFHILPDDCITLYDAYSSSWESELVSLCSDLPTRVYKSTGPYLTVTFSQGAQQGRRWFTMKYTCDTLPSKAEVSFEEFAIGMAFLFILICIIVVKRGRSPTRGLCQVLCETGVSCMEVCCSWCRQPCDCLSSKGSSRGDYQQSQADIEVVHSQPASNTSRCSSSSVQTEAEDEDVGSDSESTDEPNQSYLDLVVNPSAPPNYETVVEDIPTPRQEVTAPPLTFHDTANAPPPPSYESLFKDSSKV